jgi:uncharacterized membrane protein YeaQ/YmgE (transglycosylase-associated protein family)
MAIILFLIMGLVIGFIARAITPGRDPMGWGMTMLVGIAGSFIGWGIGRLFGLYHGSIQVVRPAGFVMSLVGAVVLLLATRGVRRRRIAA